jgi:broad specificity phosphatase PhoE
MFGIYLTHPQIRIEPDVPVPRWGLSEIGIARAEKAAQRGWAQQLSRILSSDETKALETAAILSRSNGLDVEVLEHSGENDRSATGFLVPEEFEKAANWFFANPRTEFPWMGKGS